jgi:hypothetical protein
MISVVALTGCQPSHTPSPPAASSEVVNTPLPVRCDPITITNDIGLSILTTSDFSQIYLGPDTEILFTPTGYCPGLDEHFILLKKGQVAISSKLPEGQSIQIASPDGYLSKLGGTGLVTYVPDEHIFGLSCSSEPCSLGVSESSLIVLACGQSATLDASGVLIGPAGINLGELAPFGMWLIPQCGIFVPATGTPETQAVTPDAAATATAACGVFQDQFPLTPCPPFTP